MQLRKFVVLYNELYGMKTKLTFLVPILVLVLTFKSYSQCDHLTVNEYTGSYKKVSDKELEFAQVHGDSL